MPTAEDPEASYLQATNLLPSAGINVDLGNGPGIQEVATFSVAVAGAKGRVAVSNAQRTVTGAVGGVLLRPCARLTSSAGDSVTTYGETWDMRCSSLLNGCAVVGHCAILDAAHSNGRRAVKSAVRLL